MICSVDGCERSSLARGLCKMHWTRWSRHGDPLVSLHRPRGLSEEEVFQWFMLGDPPTEGCWDWRSSVSQGYGQFSMPGRHVLAHVVSHRIYNHHDPLTDEKPFVLHSCDRGICCQPRHLRAGSSPENVLDAVERGRNAFGQRVPQSRLTDESVIEIRRRYREDGVAQGILAEEFGVTQTTISCVVLGKTWRHLL